MGWLAGDALKGLLKGFEGRDKVACAGRLFAHFLLLSYNYIRIYAYLQMNSTDSGARC